MNRTFFYDVMLINDRYRSYKNESYIVFCTRFGSSKYITYVCVRRKVRKNDSVSNRSSLPHNVYSNKWDLSITTNIHRQMSHLYTETKALSFCFYLFILLYQTSISTPIICLYYKMTLSCQLSVEDTLR